MLWVGNEKVCFFHWVNSCPGIYFRGTTVEGFACWICDIVLANDGDVEVFDG